MGQLNLKLKAFSKSHVVSLVAIVFVAAFSYTTVGQTSQNLSVANEPTPSNWSGSVSTSLNSNAEKWGSEDHTFTNDYMLSLKRSIGKHAIDWNIGSSKDFLGERKYEWNNTALGYTTPAVNLNKVMSAKIKTSVAVPLNEQQRKYETLLAQATLSPSINFKLEELGFTGVSFSYRPFVRQNFHTYTVSKEGKSNTERSIRQRIGLGFSITDNFSLDFDGSYTRNYTYHGHTTDSYALDESITYSWLSNFSTSLGHSTDGSALGPDGKSNNIQFSDVRKSTYYFSAEYTF